MNVVMNFRCFKTFRFKVFLVSCIFCFLLLPGLYGRTQIITCDSLPVLLNSEIMDVCPENSYRFSDGLTGQEQQRGWNTEYKNVGFQRYYQQSTFVLGDYPADSCYYLLVGPTLYANRVYVNGSLFVSRGCESPGLNSRVRSYDFYLIPDKLLNKDGKPNEIVTELVSTRGYRGTFPDTFITTRDEAVRSSFFKNYINIDLPRLLNIASVITCLFFLFVYYVKRKGGKKYIYLIFSGIALSLAMSCVDAAFGSGLSDSFVLERISMAGVFLLGLTEILFVNSYYGLMKKWKCENLVLCGVTILLFCAVLPVILIDRADLLIGYYHFMVDAFMTPLMVTIIFICFYKARKNPVKKNIVLFVAYFISGAGAAVNIIFYKKNLDFDCIWIAYSVQLLLLLYFFVLEFEDIVDELRAKSNILRQQNQMMESVIEERTKELAVSNAKLSESVEELGSANKLKDKFFSIIAHDIKNPLSTMIGFSQLLQDDFADYDDDQKLEIIRQINSDSVNLYKILENLLEWSRCKVGRMVFSPVELRVGDIMKEILPLEQNKAKAKNIRIRCDYDDNQIVYADANMLKSILRNLIGNAIKFSYAGGVIEVVVCSHEGRTEIRVSDQGVGMSPDQAGNLFRLDRVESAIGTNNESGTGLGLIVCKEFVDYHKGIVRVESEKDKGTMFIVCLPDSHISNES